MDLSDKTAWQKALAGRAQTGGRSIGALLIDAGTITPADADRVLKTQGQTGLRFGEAAKKLGLVTESELQQALCTQFGYAYLHSDSVGVSHEVVAAYEPFTELVEQLRALRSQLILRWFSPQRKLLAIVSPGRGEGRSYVAANLAVVLSQLGKRTLLVDADLRHPRQHQLFALDNSVGLSTALSERCGLDAVRRVPGLAHLGVMPCGAPPPNPMELLGREVFADLLKAASERFDVVILDTPAAATGTDYQFAAGQAGGALLVARRNVTPTRQCKAVAEGVTAARGELVGTVLNDR